MSNDRIESSATVCGQLPAGPNCQHAAANNEIIRLIWACHKEQYLLPEDRAFFTVRRCGGTAITIQSLEDAQRVLYDARLKDDFHVEAVLDGRSVALRGPRDLLDLMRPWLQRAFPHMSIDDERWNHWLDVSEQAVRNEAQALADKVRLDAEIAPYGSVVSYASGLPPNESFAFFCRYAAYFGRFDMPFSKMRLPVGNAEAAFHAPEFGRDVPVTVVAIAQCHLRINGGDASSLTQWLRREHPQAYTAWEQALRKAGHQPARFAPMPVHPLSLPLFATYLKSLVSDGEALLNTGTTVMAKAGLSYRTMIPHGEDGNLTLKLPVPLQLTGYVRNIDMEELRCAPQLSERIAHILAEERGFGGRLRLDRELLTAGVVPFNGSAQPTRDTAYLACLLRENQSRALPAGSITMPLAALFSASSLTGKPILVEAMEKSGADSQEQAMAYFRHYQDMLLNSTLRMFLRHGIMLEAHQQNLGVTLDMTGHVEMLHYHDLACAVFFYRPAYLAAGHPGPTLLGMSHPYASDEARHACSQFVHTVLLLNLLPVIDIIAGEYSIPKPHLLRLIGETITGILREERQHRAAQGGPAAAVFERFHGEFEQHVLAAPTFSAKRLLGRLFAQSQTPAWGQVPNRDTAFAAVRGSAVPIENPLHPFHVRDLAAWALS